MLSGLGFIVVGMFHPLNVPSAVTTATWVNVHIVATVMCFFGLYGMAGLYARQAERSGWLGLAGFVLFSLWLALSMPFLFLEAFVLPRWAGALFAFGAVLIPVGALVPPEYQPELIMIPVGLAVTWLGYALWSQRRVQASEPVPAVELRPGGAD